MDRVVTCVEEWTGDAVERQEQINCHHNYTVQERHFGKDVWLSRKGAIHAGAGEPGADPGIHGHPLVRRCGQGERDVAQLVAARRGARVQPDRARKTFTQEIVNVKGD